MKNVDKIKSINDQLHRIKNSIMIIELQLAQLADEVPETIEVVKSNEEWVPSYDWNASSC